MQHKSYYGKTHRHRAGAYRQGAYRTAFYTGARYHHGATSPPAPRSHVYITGIAGTGPYALIMATAGCDGHAYYGHRHYGRHASQGPCHALSRASRHGDAAYRSQNLDAAPRRACRNEEGDECPAKGTQSQQKQNISSLQEQAAGAGQTLHTKLWIVAACAGRPHFRGPARYLTFG